MRFQPYITLFARRKCCDRIITESLSVPGVGVGDIDRSLSELNEQIGADVVRMHMGAGQILTTGLKGEKDGDVMFRIAPTRGA